MACWPVKNRGAQAPASKRAAARHRSGCGAAVNTHTTQRCWRSSRRRGWQDHTYPVPVQRNLGEPRTRDTHVSGTCIIREQHGEQGIPSDQHKGTSIVGFLWLVSQLVRISRLGTQGREQRPRGRGLDGGCHRSTPRIGHTLDTQHARGARAAASCRCIDALSCELLSDCWKVIQVKSIHIQEQQATKLQGSLSNVLRTSGGQQCWKGVGGDDLT